MGEIEGRRRIGLSCLGALCGSVANSPAFGSNPNRQIQVLEPTLSHSKQRIAPLSNRQISQFRICSHSSSAARPSFEAPASSLQARFLIDTHVETGFALTHRKQRTAM